MWPEISIALLLRSGGLGLQAWGRGLGATTGDLDGVPGRAMRAISGGQPGGAGVLHGRRCLYFLLGARSGLFSKLLPMRVEVPRG